MSNKRVASLNLYNKTWIALDEICRIINTGKSYKERLSRSQLVEGAILPFIAKFNIEKKI